MISWTDVASESRDLILGAGRIDEARLLLKLAIEYRRDGWPNRARRYARRALSIFGREAQADLDSIRALLCLAGARADLADYPRAKQEFQRAGDLIDRLAMDDEVPQLPLLRVQTMRGLAGVILALGDSRQAETILKEALGVAQESFGAGHAEVASVLHALGLLYARTGLHTEAARLQHLALALTEKALGSQHPRVADILYHLGLLEQARGRFAVGEALARRAAAIRHSALGPDHPEVAAALATVGTLLKEQRKPSDAELHLKRARVIRERWFGGANTGGAGSNTRSIRTLAQPTQRLALMGAPSAPRGNHSADASGHISSDSRKQAAALVLDAERQELHAIVPGTAYAPGAADALHHRHGAAKIAFDPQAIAHLNHHVRQKPHSVQREVFSRTRPDVLA